MAITKRVIILERLSPQTPGPTESIQFRYLMWADVPAARQPFYAQKQAAMVSAWKDAAQADTTALQSGAVTEFVDIIPVAPGTSLVSVEALLQSIWTAFQARITAENPWQRYGSFMDTTNTWTAGGVA